MKIAFFFLLTILSSNNWSQINSGGGPDGDGGPNDIPQSELFNLHSQYKELLVLSNRQWKFCFNESSGGFDSFQELYLQLIWIDLKSSVTVKNCNLDDQYKDKEFPCFFQNEDFRSNLKRFFNSKYIGSFLNYVEGQDSTEKELINYFKDKTVEGE